MYEAASWKTPKSLQKLAKDIFADVDFANIYERGRHISTSSIFQFILSKYTMSLGDYWAFNRQYSSCHPSNDAGFQQLQSVNHSKRYQVITYEQIVPQLKLKHIPQSPRFIIYDTRYGDQLKIGLNTVGSESGHYTFVHRDYIPAILTTYGLTQLEAIVTAIEQNPTVVQVTTNSQIFLKIFYQGNWMPIQLNQSGVMRADELAAIAKYCFDLNTKPQNELSSRNRTLSRRNLALL